MIESKWFLTKQRAKRVSTKNLKFHWHIDERNSTETLSVVEQNMANALSFWIKIWKAKEEILGIFHINTSSQRSSMKYFKSSGQDHCYKLEGFTLFHATTLKWIPYIHSIVYTPTSPSSQMYLNIHKYTGSVKAIDLYKSYHATVLYRIIVYKNYCNKNSLYCILTRSSENAAKFKQ